MNFRNILLVCFGAYIVSMFSKGQAAAKLRVLFSGCKFAKGGGLIPQLQLSFQVQNVSSASITLQSVVGDLYVNGKNAANVSSFDRQTIAGNSQSVISVNVIPSIAGIVQIVSNALNTGLHLVAVFRGNLHAEGLILPINQSVTVIK